jgi:hypothetical protein
MNRADVVDIADALRRFPGVRSATARGPEPRPRPAESAWVVTFAVGADDVGREAAELVRLTVQEIPRVQIRELPGGGQLVLQYTLRGLSESDPAQLAALLNDAGQRMFEHLRNH